MQWFALQVYGKHLLSAIKCTCAIRKINLLKPLDTFGTEKKLKVHRFTNNLQGLQKVMVKDFCWNIIPWNALLFEKNIKTISILDIENYGFILNTCHKGGFSHYFLLTPMDDQLSLNFHRFVILYLSCDTRSVGLGQYCLPKVSNGLKERLWEIIYF